MYENLASTFHGYWDKTLTFGTLGGLGLEFVVRSLVSLLGWFFSILKMGV